MADFTGYRIWLWALLFLPKVLQASDAHHEINWWHFGSAYKDAPAVGWLIITFLIFVYGCVHAIRKPLSLYLETRSKDIRKEIEEGQIAKENSEEKLKLYEERLKSLDGELEQLKVSFAELAEAEKGERAHLAKDMESRIFKDAEDTIKANFARSKNRLAEETVNRAMDIAFEIIATKKRDQVDEFLKNSFIDDLNAMALIKETLRPRSRDEVVQSPKNPYIKGLMAKAAEEVQ